MKIFRFFLALLLFSGMGAGLNAQDLELKDGLKYKIFNPHNGVKPVLGQTAVIDMWFYGDKPTLIFSSEDRGKPLPITLSQPQFKGDLITGLMMMSAGDSGVFLVSSDSIIKYNGSNPAMKAGSFLKYIIKLRSIYDPAAQLAIDESVIKAYIKANKIKGVKHTSSGLYYKITEKGKGAMPKTGQTLNTHYTGKLLDGKVFDSDKGAGFSFQLGNKEVIQGWEEGFALLPVGSKATLFLPSTLAYGVLGGGEIPSNTVLLFEVELVSVK